MLSTQELEGALAGLETRIVTELAPYEPQSAICLWLDIMRGIEEIINLPNVDWDDDNFEQQLYEFPLLQLMHYGREFQAIRRRLIARFSEKFANRFCNILSLGSAIGISFEAHRMFEAASGFKNVMSMIGYLQSRRRHFVGLLHLMPHACRGTRLISHSNVFNCFLPIVECTAVPMMSVQYLLMVRLAQQRLGLNEDGKTELPMLNTFYLEPERASIVEMIVSNERAGATLEREPLQADRLFSAAELRNDILAIEAVYAEFDLNKTDFAVAATLVRRLSTEFINRDYWVEITPKQLNCLVSEVGATANLRSALTCGADNYMLCLSSYAPFVRDGDRYLSTVSLLSRFIYNWRARILNKSKRFQIRAGFIFEDQVKDALKDQGFTIQEIVRIDRQEFDVVTIQNGVIWNVQCKNNFIDLDRVDMDATSFARYNKHLVRSYERALTKEFNREHLLQCKLNLADVQHMVVSRFPVITDNPRIVVFSRIGDFSRRASEILSNSSLKFP
ncbi:hypothetical protein [Undibacterium baiyunense]|uniref:Nuclease-related domain-containing protein n=1 Tax=Undibacterium baiyunense TaxID=2828731 RepID=A0A941DCJ0_9BURK|nr:hypothetical protein [Undibacterium baiyunense]MBR7745143.1 hypothetical protein [Undibacterium baiyunense]